MSKSLKLVLKYAVFALFATAVNLLMQEFVTRFYHGLFTLTLAMLAGTIAGLVVKYILDKRYIFCFQTKNTIHNTKLFFFYCFMGGVTTLVFWGGEFLFQGVFETKSMRYLGAVIGLSIGYVTKYYLDKTYVFRGDV